MTWCREATSQMLPKSILTKLYGVNRTNKINMLKSNHWNPFEDRVHVEFIFWCLIFKWVAETWLPGGVLWLPWWRHQMETFSALLALCEGNSPVTGEFPAQRPVARSSDVFFDLRRYKRLSKQSWGWWFETPSGSLWRHRNERYSTELGELCLHHTSMALPMLYWLWQMVHYCISNKQLNLCPNIWIGRC